MSEFQAPGHPPQVELVPGALTTAGLDFHLIPLVALERLAERFMLGEVRKGSKAWNALSSNQHILTEKKFILARLSHVIHHTYKLMNKIANDLPLTDDDDAGAIAWGGVFAICASDALTKQNQAHKQDGLADARKQIKESATYISEPEYTEATLDLGEGKICKTQKRFPPKKELNDVDHF